MSENNESVAPKWFKVVAILALIWNLMGVVAYLMRAFRGDEAIAALPEAERAYLQAVPAWATAAFAFAVWGGALGSLALVLKKSWAYPVLIISVLGIAGQTIHSFILANAMEVYGMMSLIMMIITLAIGIFLVWLANSAKSKGWIG
jgi:hypothetical protein